MDDAAAEVAALTAAVKAARAEPDGVPHDEMRTWLLRVAAGDLDAPPPKGRPL